MSNSALLITSPLYRPIFKTLVVVHFLLTSKMKVHFCIDDIIEYYNIYDHNTAFSVARKQEILQEISAMVEENKRKEKMYYHLQYGLFHVLLHHPLTWNPSKRLYLSLTRRTLPLLTLLRRLTPQSILSPPLFLLLFLQILYLAGSIEQIILKFIFFYQNYIQF